MTNQSYNDVFKESRQFVAQVWRGDRNSDGSAVWETFAEGDSPSEMEQWIERRMAILADIEKDDPVKTNITFRVRKATWTTGAVRTYPPPEIFQLPVEPTNAPVTTCVWPSPACGDCTACNTQPRCRSDSEGNCCWAGCPQLRDGEPDKSGRSCPLWENEDEI